MSGRHGICITLMIGAGSLTVGAEPFEPAPPPVRAPAISLVLNPQVLIGGQNATAIATLEQPAGANGRTLNIVNGNPSAASMPSQLVFGPGAQTAQFTINALPVATETAVQITVGPNTAVPGVATLTIRRPSVSAFTAALPTVTGSQPVSATITLNGPAPSGGLSIPLTSNSPAATPPPSVTVPANGTSASFTIQTAVVPRDSSVTVSATSTADVGGGTVSTTQVSLRLTVQAIAVSAITFPVTSLRAGYSTVGTVRLNAPAPPGGLQLRIDGHNRLSAALTSVTVPANATVQSFPVTASCCAAGTGHVTARVGLSGTTATSPTLTVIPFRITAIDVAPSFLPYSSTVRFTVTLTVDTVLPLPPVFIPSFSVRATGSTPGYGGEHPVAMGPGTTTGSNTFVLLGPASLQTVQWSASVSVNTAYGPALATSVVAPPEVDHFFFLGGATSVYGGQRLNSYTDLSEIAPSPGVAVLVGATPGSVAVPSNTPAVVPSGRAAQSFDLIFSPVAQPTTVTVSARTYNRPEAVVKTATITVLPPELTKLVLATTSVTRGLALGGTVHLNFPAPAGGAVVTLSATPGNAVTMPASVTIPAGTTSASFPIRTAPVPNRATITASYQGRSVSAVLTIT